MKRAWDPMRLRVLWWHAKPPEPGDEVHTKSGRRYLIRAVHPKALDVVVLPPDEPCTGKVFLWEWGKRARR